MAAKGSTVLLVARRADELERLRAEIAASGGRAATYPCDLADGEAVDALVKQVLQDHGAVDYLVNNAGRSIRRSLHLSYDRFHDFERTMAINYFAPVRLTMGLLPAMREQRFGHVVNIVTWGVQMKAPKFAAYIASKTALDTWSRIAGRETYGDNVTFTNMRFGLVRTAMVVPTGTVEDRRALSAEQAAARVVRALEDRPIVVSNLAAHLGEVLNLLAPRLSDALMYRYDRAVPGLACRAWRVTAGRRRRSRRPGRPGPGAGSAVAVGRSARRRTRPTTEPAASSTTARQSSSATDHEDHRGHHVGRHHGQRLEGVDDPELQVDAEAEHGHHHHARAGAEVAAVHPGQRWRRTWSRGDIRVAASGSVARVLAAQPAAQPRARRRPGGR